MIKVEKFPAGPKIMVRFRESGVTEEDMRESETSSNRGVVDEATPEPMECWARPTAQEQSHFPTAPEIMDMPPPSNHDSSSLILPLRGIFPSLVTKKLSATLKLILDVNQSMLCEQTLCTRYR